MLDLTLGEPIDVLAPAVREQMAQVLKNVDMRAYPRTAGTESWRERARQSLGFSGSSVGVMPIGGAKEFIASAFNDLGHAGATVGMPTYQYPTYRVAVSTLRGSVSLGWEPGSADVDVAFVNSPHNPTGLTRSEAELGQHVRWAQEGSHRVLISDECYTGLSPGAVSLRQVVESLGTSWRNLLVVQSFSKSHNAAGLRAGLVFGDQRLVDSLVARRRERGATPSVWQQEVTLLLLADTETAVEQGRRYSRRRALVTPALRAAGFTVSDDQAGMFVWMEASARHGISPLDWFTSRGIQLTPGSQFGAPDRFLRMSLAFPDSLAPIIINGINK